jgi:DNA-directed RNA polymerase specialized sigma subunit
MPIRDEDITLWKQWKKNKNPQTTSALVNQLLPLVKNDVVRYANNIPYPVAEAHAKDLIIDACTNYNPNQGVALSTFVKSYMPKMNQVSQAWLGTIKIPSHRRDKYSTFKNSYETLSNSLRRDPSTSELADHLGWSQSEVARFLKEIRSEFTEDRPVYSDYKVHSSKEEEMIDFIYHDLSSEEKILFEFRTGYGGKPKLSNEKIMKRLGMNQNQLSYKLKKLEQKIEEMLNAN